MEIKYDGICYENVAGTAENDTITVNRAQTITVDGNAGNDSISIQNADHTTVGGGAGVDTIRVDFANTALIKGQDGDDDIYLRYTSKKTGSGNVSIEGGAGDDTITVGRKPNGGDDLCDDVTVFGGAGDDSITVIASNASIEGGAGNDTIINDHGLKNVYFDGGDDDDYIDMDNYASTVLGGAGNDFISVKGSSSTVDGGTGDDTIKIWGWAEDLFVTGGAGADTFLLVQPGFGATLTDLTAEDTLVFSFNPEAYALAGSGGRLSSLSASYSGTTLTLKGTMQGQPTLNLTLKNIKSLSSISDVKVYNGSVNGTLNPTNLTTLGKLLGASTSLPRGASVSGGKVVLSNSFKGTFSLANYFNRPKDITASTNKQKLMIKGDDRANIITAGNAGNTLYGYSGNDKLVGGAGADLLYGGAGVDTLAGGAGNDKLYGEAGADLLQGGAGNDKLDGGAGNDKLYGGAGNDKLVGSAGNDYLYGEAGNDTLNGGAGNDNLRGGAGNDALTGGADNDVFTYANGEGKDTITDYTAGQDTLYITSNAISKTALSGKNVVFTVGKGSVTLSNAKGKTVSLKDNRGGFTLASSAIALASDFGGAMDVAKYWSTVRTVDGSKTTKTATLTGNAAANTLKGGSGANTLNGGAGNDKLYGYAGNDKLNGGVGNDYLDGGVGNDKLTGGAGNDTFVYAYDKGNDVIADYEQGKDKLLITGATSVPAEIGPIYSTKQSGKDVVFRFSVCTATVKNGAGKTIALQDNRGGYTMSPTALTLDANFSGRIDAGRYLGTIKTMDGRKAQKAVSLIGNSQSNVIYGGTGSDFISGEAGNDKIYGGAGNDSLMGGDGADYLDGGAGNDTFSAGSGNDTLYGGAGNDHLYAGAGNDSVDGGDGNDMIYGREGNDTITGGKGRDTFVYYTGCGNDLIKDYAQGEDTLYITEGSVSAAAVSGNNLALTIGGGKVTLQNAAAKTVTVKADGGTYTLNKTSLTAQAGFGGTLSAKAHLSTIKTVDGRAATRVADIHGNSIANVLYAGKSGGTLRGWEGNDTLYGGAGADVFYYDSGDDTIYNYAEGTDKIGVGAAAIKSATVSGSDLILKTANGGKITIKGAAAKTVTLIDKDGVESTYKYDPNQSVSQLSVIQNFMAYLDETNGLSADELVNGAVNYASNGLFTSWDDLVNRFADDLAVHGGTKLESLLLDYEGNLIIEPAVEKFLTDYCGINLRNADTGAITGADAGGATAKTKTSIVPENGTIANVQSPQGASTTINGLTFLWPEEALNATQQAIVNRIYTWWAKGALDLIEESYALSFTEEGATVNQITVQFRSENNNNLAWVTHSTWTSGQNVGKCAGLTLTVNMNYFNDIDLEDVNGDAGGTAGYLDRVLAHELTHAVMAANINYFRDLPAAVQEGLAELVHGIDDTRTQTINQYAQTANADALRNNLKLNIASESSYAGGYMLFRYFAKQVAENSLGAMMTGSSGMIANSAPIAGSPAAQLASLVSTMQAGNLGALSGGGTSLASSDASGSSLIVANGASNPLTNQRTA